MQTLAVPFVGEMPRMLGTSASNASWVVTVTLLAGAVSIPVTGAWDLHGKRAVLLACACRWPPGRWCAREHLVVRMIVGRGPQGVGWPTRWASAGELLPPERLARRSR